MSTHTKRVVLVMDYGNVRGGLEKVCIESALALKDQGLEVVFFCGVQPIDPRLKAAGVETHCLGISDIASDASRAKAMQVGLWNSEAAKRLNVVIRNTNELESTVVHLHGWTKSLSSAIGPVITAPDVRHVVTMHEYFLGCPNGGFFNYQTNEICHLKGMSLPCITTNCDVRHFSHKAYRVVRQAIQSNLAGMPRKLRAVIHISELQKELLQPYFDPATTFYSVQNPINVAKGARITAEQNASFALLGRMAESKGVIEFAQAAKTAKVPALFIGDGELHDAALAANPDAQITSWLDPDDAIRKLGTARALVLPSRWQEPFGLVAAEALSKGLPVIAGRWGAAHEFIEDGVNGCLISHLDELPQRMQTLQDNEYVAQLSKAAYSRYWSAPLTMKRHLGNLLAVYDQVQT